MKTNSEYLTTGDLFNKVKFEKISTSALKIEVNLQKGFSGGILEWIVN